MGETTDRRTFKFSLITAAPDGVRGDLTSPDGLAETLQGATIEVIGERQDRSGVTMVVLDLLISVPSSVATGILSAYIYDRLKNRSVKIVAPSKEPSEPRRLEGPQDIELALTSNSAPTDKSDVGGE
jgi:hypothetical protein